MDDTAPSSPRAANDAQASPTLLPPDFGLAVLSSFDLAVLRRLAPNQYEFLGEPPVFYSTLYPAEADGSPCRAPWQHSPMLELFLEDMETFFETSREKKLHSGIWQEDHKGLSDCHLIAVACCVQGQQICVVRSLGLAFKQHANIIQKAREYSLERRQIDRTLAFYKEKSEYDSLTGLYSKAIFLDILKTSMAQSRHQGIGLSLLMLDIDDFKKINDTYGHLAGDAVLATLGDLLRTSLRQRDIAGRYGGEEFIILAPHTGAKQAGLLAEKLCRRVAKQQFPNVPSVTVSIGYTNYLPGDGHEDLIQRADDALYEAKRAGKNTTRIG